MLCVLDTHPAHVPMHELCIHDILVHIQISAFYLSIHELCIDDIYMCVHTQISAFYVSIHELCIHDIYMYVHKQVSAFLHFCMLFSLFSVLLYSVMHTYVMYCIIPTYVMYSTIHTYIYAACQIKMHALMHDLLLLNFIISTCRCSKLPYCALGAPSRCI